MANKKFSGYSKAIAWYVPNRIRPICTSTVAAKDAIKHVFIAEGYKTANEIMNAINNGIFLGGQEEEFILNQYISKGFGDMELIVS